MFGGSVTKRRRGTIKDLIQLAGHRGRIRKADGTPAEDLLAGTVAE